MTISERLNLCLHVPHSIRSWDNLASTFANSGEIRSVLVNDCGTDSSDLSSSLNKKFEKFEKIEKKNLFKIFFDFLITGLSKGGTPTLKSFVSVWW